MTIALDALASITDEQVKKMILENRRITIREVADDVGISFGSCQAIFSDVLGMKRVAAKFVPKLLNFDQKQCRVDIAQELLNEVNNDPELLKNGHNGSLRLLSIPEAEENPKRTTFCQH